MRRILGSLLLVFVAVCCILWLLFEQTPQRIDPAAAVPPQHTDSEFLGSDACKKCHTDQHASWYQTYHRTMTQLASPDTVLAPFDAEIDVDGQQFRLFQQDDDFWVEMDDPEWERVVFQEGDDTRQQPERKRATAQIVMTTGSHHFQAYWLRSAYGRELWQFPLRYDLVEKKWVHRKDVFLGPPQWKPGMHFKVWNDNCIFCHATGGEPGFDSKTNLMANTTVSELGISCESCHGPGRDHVALHSTGSTQSAEDDPMINPKKLDHEVASEICGSCHSNFLHDDPELLVRGAQFRPGRRLTEFGRFYRPQLEKDGDIISRFWADGTNRSTGREFMGMKDSACYRNGAMSCLSCHSMHESDPNDQLRVDMNSNEACLQCHEDMREDIEAHTHHAAESSGSQCYNCHMPYTNYGLFKATRSHSITSPSVESIQHKTRPNACNLCHLDESLAWTSKHLANWYGQPAATLEEDERVTSAWALWALRGDAGQRVVAAWHPRWQQAQEAAGSEWTRIVLEELAKDPYSAVSYVAEASIKRLPNAAPATKEQRAKTLGVAKGQSLAERIAEIIERRDNKPIASVE